MTPLFYTLADNGWLPQSMLDYPPGTDYDNKLNFTGKCVLGTTIGDGLIIVTSLVIGILGALRVLRGMPPAVSYSLIALGGIFTLSWMPLLLDSEGRKEIKMILSADFCSITANESDIEGEFETDDDGD